MDYWWGHISQCEVEDGCRRSAAGKVLVVNLIPGSPLKQRDILYT